MNKIKLILIAAGIFSFFTGCATLKNGAPIDIDRTAQTFFDDLQRSDHQGAYHLFAKGLSQSVSFDQFDEFMNSIREEWGRIESDETALMPFHKRQGESSFIPLNVSGDKIKRYIFDVKFEHADMNFDLTLAPEGDGYKIIWFSVWGSSIYLTPKIREKIETLFAKPDTTSP
ncbi:MAG: hypothetical protein HQL14_06540 [Candidatus Omnitrophica bacterium]|nr:hypothetical protein [Candidatus Omnitrophota bacterium]